MREFLCNICHKVSSAEEWNKKTVDTIGEEITNIEDDPEFMFCPKCNKKIYDWDF